MKYYLCLQFSENGNYSSHRYICIDDNNITDYLDEHEHFYKITKRGFDQSPSFYKFYITKRYGYDTKKPGQFA